MVLPLAKKDLLVASDKTPVDRQFFNRRFDAIYGALTALDVRQGTYDDQVQRLVTLGLQRLNDELGPFLTVLQQASDLGFLVCEAVGLSVTLTEGAPADWVVTAGIDLFTPTPFLFAEDQNDSTNWGVVELVTWTKETGDLATNTVYAAKNQASTAWTISASPAALPAMKDLLADCVTARDATASSAATVAAAMAELSSLIEAIQSGPVSSVAGRTGAIVLGIADITGLTDALAAKVSTTSLTASLSGKQAASAKLDALVGLGWAANKLLMASGPGSLSTVDVTAFAIALLAAASAADARTVLGLGDIAVRMAADFALLASPALTGTPTAPTPAATDNSQKIATTAFVHGAARRLPPSLTDINGSASGNNATVTLPKPPPVGSMIIVAIVSAGATSNPEVSDNIGNNYLVVPETIRSGAGLKCWVFYCPAIAGVVQDICLSASNNPKVFVDVVIGQHPTAPIDRGAVASGTGATASVSLASTHEEDLIWAMVWDNTAAITPQYAPDSGLMNGNPGTSANPGITAAGVRADPATANVTFRRTSSTTWEVAAIAIKPAWT